MASPKNASRKYVDLVYSASTKFANWDPSSPIEVGDYGQLHPKTGIFQVRGNIYKDPEVRDKIPHLSPPVEGEPENNMVISSYGSVTTNFGVAQATNAAGLVDLGIGGTFSFSRRRGALLVLAGFRLTSLPVAMVNDFMDLEILKGNSIVTSAVSCRGYALSLSNTGGDSVSVFLQANVPLPPAPGLVVGGAVAASWAWKSVNGLSRDGWNAEGRRAFVPLFTLKNPRRRTIFERFRGNVEPPVPEGYDLLEKTDLPWGDLNEDGESEGEDGEY